MTHVHSNKQFPTSPQGRPRMYELEYPAPEISAAPAQGPTLVVALHGYADAGNAIQTGAEHLLSALEHRRLVLFNNDELLDYRSRRPAVVIDENQVSAMEPLDLEISVCRDEQHTMFLLLTGPEPDLRWEAFSQAVADIVDKYNVDQTICLYSAPMAVPHTRPMVVTAHGTVPELLQGHYTIDATVRVPGAAQLSLERALGQRGNDVVGYTVHVPHYVAASDYPEASLRLLESVENAARLSLPLASLEKDSEKVMEQLHAHLEQSAELQGVVEMLERQYDSELEKFRIRRQSKPIESKADIPSSEELGEEFERFLSQITPPEWDVDSADPSPDASSASEPGSSTGHKSVSDPEADDGSETDPKDPS